MNIPIYVNRVRSRIWSYYESIGELRNSKIWIFDRKTFEPRLCNFEGLYVLLSNEGDVLYVGKSKNLSVRLVSHFDRTCNTSFFMDFVHYIVIIKGKSKLEGQLISELSPIFNIVKSDKYGKMTQMSEDNIAIIKEHIIDQFPNHRDEVIKIIVSKRRMDERKPIKGLAKYNDGASIDEVLGLLSLITG